LRTAAPSYGVYYPWSAAHWKQETFSLDNYSGDILIRFRARFGNSNNLYIDNIQVGSPVGLNEHYLSEGEDVVPGCYPNPFIHSTVIEYQLPKSTNVTVSIYNCQGKRVSILCEEQQSSGMHRIRWKSVNQPPGIYIATISAKNISKSIRLVKMDR
jgi:hypothetical protein